LTGLNEGLVPVVAGGCLQIRRTSESEEPIQFLISAPNLDAAAITLGRWNLPGLHVEVEPGDGVTLEPPQWIAHPRYGRCLEVRYRTPSETAKNTQVLELRPAR